MNLKVLQTSRSKQWLNVRTGANRGLNPPHASKQSKLTVNNMIIEVLSPESIVDILKKMQDEKALKGTIKKGIFGILKELELS